MSGGGGNTQTVQKADPWIGQQPYLTDLFQQAQNIYQTRTPQYFPKSTVSGFTPAQVAGQQGALDAAGAMVPTLQTATQGANFLASPDILSPDSNPYLAATAQAAARPIVQTLNEQLLPSIRQDAIVAGNLGNDRQGIAEGLAVRGAADAIADRTFGMYSDAYGQGLEALARGTALAPSVAQSMLMPSQVYSGVGAEQQAMNQAQLSDQVNRWNYEQQLPWQELSNYMSIVQGNYGGTSSTMQSSQQNPLTSAMMGGLGGAAMGSLVPGFGGSLLTGGGGALLGPAGWAGMALGAGLGLFG